MIPFEGVCIISNPNGVIKRKEGPSHQKTVSKRGHLNLVQTIL